MRYQILVALIAVVLLVGVVSADTALIYTTNEGDGMIRRGGENLTFSDINTGAGNIYASVTNLYYLDSVLNMANLTNCYRAYNKSALIFNTSILPDTSTISSSTLGIYVKSDYHPLGDTGVNIIKFDINGTLDSSDYVNFSESTVFSSAKLVSSMATDKYYNWSFDARGIENISKTGNSGFGVALNYSTNAETPVWGESDAADTNRSGIQFRAGESVISPPFLEVVYTVPVPIAGFTAFPLYGYPPLDVIFTDLSTGDDINYYNWSFGDNIFSSERNPTHIYYNNGNFTVNLSVGSPYGNSTKSISQYVNIFGISPAWFPWCDKQDVFFWRSTSDVIAYNKSDHIPQLASEQIITKTISVADGRQLIASFITPNDTAYNTFLLAPSEWKFHGYFNISATGGTTTVEYKVYNRTVTGTETDLFFGHAITSDISTVGVPLEYITSYARRNYTYLNYGDRLVVKVYATTTSVPNRNISIILAGNSHASYVELGYFICNAPSYFSIPHTLGKTPSYIVATPSVIGDTISVISKNATAFIISITKNDGTKGSAQWVYWCVGLLQEVLK